MPTTILIPIDLSELSRAAVRYADEFAKALGEPHLILAHVYSLPSELELYAVQQGKTLLEALSEQAAKELESMITSLQDAGTSCEYVSRAGTPAETICELAAERQCDYIVMTTHGRTGLAHAALGSVAERTLRLAPCPVITLKAQS